MKHLDTFFTLATFLVIILTAVFYFQGDAEKAGQGLFISVFMLIFTVAEARMSFLNRKNSSVKP